MKKNIRKVLALLFAVSILATQAIVPGSAADVVEDIQCSVCGEHAVLGAVITKTTATCTAEEYTVYKCAYVDENGKACTGTISKQTGPTVAHKSDGTWVDEVKATCTKEGTKAYTKCEYCGKYLDKDGKVITNLTIAKLPHSYKEEVIAPTCTEDGYKYNKCTVCGFETARTPIAKLGHKYVTVPEKAPTCMEEGYTAYEKCERCGEVNPEKKGEVIPKLQHGLKETGRKAATCTEDGYINYQCEEESCPVHNGITVVLPKLGHSYKTVAAKVVTCTTNGNIEYKYCTRCDATFDMKGNSITRESTVIKHKGHTPVSIDYVAPTCEEEGREGKIICGKCDAVLNPGKAIPATGHTFAVKDAKEATCEESGNTQYKYCTVCNAVFDMNENKVTADSVVVPAKGHNPDSHIVTEADCEHDGEEVVLCKTCNKVLEDNVIPAKGHKLDFIPEVKATCLTSGVHSHYKCSVCDQLFSDAEGKRKVQSGMLVLRALGHNMVDVAAANPTYTAAGTKAGKKCTRCDYKEGAETLEQLKQAVRFRYTVEGLNKDNASSDFAVNGGKVQVKIYFDVLKDMVNDKNEYNSRVLAQIYSITLGMKYNKDVFSIAGNDGVVVSNEFLGAAFTDAAKANANGNLIITQDMANEDNAAKEFVKNENGYLFATVTFDVADGVKAGDFGFGLEMPEILGFEGKADSVEVTKDVDKSLSVKVRGDANGDGVFNSADIYIISEYIKNDNDPEVNNYAKFAQYDVNQDGTIDFMDINALRNMIVGNSAEV